MKIIVEKTAITTGVAKSALEIEKISNNKCKILDYGSGRLRNSLYLKSKGFNVEILDTPLQMIKMNDKLSNFEKTYNTESIPFGENYDRILCSFVLNVIECNSERINVLNNIYNLLAEKGILVCEVRKGYGISKNKYNTPYGDGFAVGKNEEKTFQRPYTESDLLEIFSQTKFKILEIKSLNDSLLVIAEKQ